MFNYSNPLINEEGGRIKTDPENERKIQLVLDRLEEWSINKKGKSL